MEPVFTSSLEPSKAARLGDPVHVRFTLFNHSDDDLYVLIWHTPLEGIKSPCLRVGHSGKPVPYDGPFAKRASVPPASAYVLVNAHGSVSRDFDLSEAYAINHTGRYEIDVVTEIKDYMTVERFRSLDAVALGARESGLRTHPLSSTPNSFEVTPGPGPRPTIAEEHRREDHARAKKKAELGLLGVFDVIGGDAAQQAAARAAFQMAHQMAHSATVAINSSTFNTWFGTADRGTVDRNYAAIKRSIREAGTGSYPSPHIPEYRLDLTGSGCESGWYAYTYGGSKTIWACSLFWSAPATGINSQAGTYVHELSHAVCGTDDIVYGTVAAQNLASSSPDQAIRNADNYEYFAESVPLVPLGPYDFAFPAEQLTSAESKYHR